MVIEKKSSKNSGKLVLLLSIVFIAVLAVIIILFIDNSKKKQAEMNREIELANNVLKDAVEWFFTHQTNVTMVYDSILMHLCENGSVNEENVTKLLDGFNHGKKMIEEDKNAHVEVGGKLYSYKNIPSDVTIEIGQALFSTDDDIPFEFYLGGPDYYKKVMSKAGSQIMPYIKDGKAYFSVGTQILSSDYRTRCGVIYYQYPADNFKKFISEDVLDNLTADDKERDLYFIELDEKDNPIIITGLNENNIAKNGYDVLEYMKNHKIYLFTPDRSLKVEKNSIKTDNGTYEVFSVIPFDRSPYYIIYSVKM